MSDTNLPKVTIDAGTRFDDFWHHKPSERPLYPPSMTKHHRPYASLPLALAAAALISGCASPNTPTPSTEQKQPAAAAASTEAATLHIEVTDLKANEGYLNLAVIDRAENWESTAKPVAAFTARVTGTTMRFTLRDLAAGRVAVRLYQDEDGNGKLDSNMLGIPTEGYGFSGKSGSMGPPSFDDAAFDLLPSGTTTKISVQ